MRKVSDIVQGIVKKSTLLSEMIGSNLGNTSFIARKIKPEVEKELLEKVSEASIVMALRRLPKTKNHRREIKEMFKGMVDISVRSNLVEFIYLHDKSFNKVDEKVIKQVALKPNDFLNVCHGVSESIIVVGKEYEKKVQSFFEQESIKPKKIDNLAAVTIRMFDESIETPGVYFEILRLLAWDNINLIEVISTGSEVSLIMDIQDVDRAFSVIRSIA